MHTQAPCRMALATLLLGLSACGEMPMAPESGATEVMPRFGKITFERCKPHVNAEEPGPNRELLAIAPEQRVFVDLGGRRVEGRFSSQLLVRAAEGACGGAALEVEVTDEAGGADILVIIMEFTGARASIEDGRTQVEFDGVAEICRESEARCETVSMTGSVGEQPIDDDPIWQFHGPVGTTTFPARTAFVAPGGDDRGSVRGDFPMQEVQQSRPTRGETGRHAFEARFEVGSSGAAWGGVRIWDISDLDNPTFEFSVEEGRFAARPDGTIIVWLSGVLRFDLDGRIEERSFAATVRKTPIDDDPIWQFHSGDVYSNSFPASGELTRF
jgi:hypothetical protein